MNIINKVTLKTLGKNKVRTLVTIIGIILSVSMFTAVTTCISSFQNFLLETEIRREGDWYGVAYSISAQKLDEIKNDSRVNQTTSLQNIGYASLEDSQNEYKPYLFIGGMDTIFTDKMPVNLIEGRLPQNSTEIILPDHLRTNGGVQLSIDETLNLSIGNRVSEGFQLNQTNSFLHPDSGLTEELIIREEKTYKVVGFYERPAFESYSAPGFTALTVAGEEERYSYDAYLKTLKPEDIYTFMDESFSDSAYSVNNSLLRYMGKSNERGFNSVLYSLAAVLIGIIMFGSISLIYNAFSISVSERTKQFGLLSSIGATRRQMMNGVLFEALSLSLIGIPFGIFSGIFGIGITFKLSENLFTALIGNNYDVMLRLSVSWEAVVIAALIGIITVLISAYIPARRTFKISAIDAIRLSKDINIKTKNLKTSKFLFKLFGIEGTIAKKNFKRSKKKYRATVISLFLSIVLFISASSFSAYLTSGINSVVDEPQYDLMYMFSDDLTEKYSFNEVFDELKKVEGVTESSYAASYDPYMGSVSVDNVSQEYMDYAFRVYGNDLSEVAYNSMNMHYFFLNDEAYKEYLEKNSLEKEMFLNFQKPMAIVYDFTRLYNGNEGRYYTLNQLNRNNNIINARYLNKVDSYYFFGEEKNEENENYYIFKNNRNEEDTLLLSAEEAVKDLKIHVGAFLEDRPAGVEVNYGGSITLIYPYNAIKTILGEDNANMSVSMYFKAHDYKAVYERMYKILSEKGITASMLINVAEMTESNRAMITVMNIFSYGFIVLISLIAAANVFNTISTNIGIRRHEFAMLKSIGMTQKMFNRMMNYECLMYGLKGLMYGIPVSIGVTWLIYKSILKGLETEFFIPWYSMAIAVGSVFAVVFATMIYSMQKIKKDNPIDALKDENL